MSKRETFTRAAALVGGAVVLPNLYARWRVGKFEDLEPGTAGAPGSFVEVDGVRLHYVEAGRGDPVVLIHGLNGSTLNYRYTIPDLAQRLRVIAFDLKGAGYSARPQDGDYSLSAQAELLVRAMNQLGIERASIVGHSLGGSIAQRIAARFPERVERLVLVDSVTKENRRGARAAWLTRPFWPTITTLTLHRKGFRRRALLSAAHDPAYVTPELVDAFFYTSRMKGHARALSLLFAHMRRDEPVDVASIRAPTLVLWGEHDGWLPLENGEALVGELPNATLDAVPSAGHLPLEEQPGYCNRALLAFLGGEAVSGRGVVATPEDLRTASPAS